MAALLHTTKALPQAEAFHSQLEDPSAAAVLSSLKTSPRRPQTLTEKIVQRYAVGLPQGKRVLSGDFITISPRRVMTHDNTWPVRMSLVYMSVLNLLMSSRSR